MGLVLFYVGTVFLLPLITVNKEEVVNKDIEIHILTNGVHTDIVVPVKTTEIDWSQKIKYSNSKNADSTYQYLAMGWGR